MDTSEDILKDVENFCVKLRPIADVCYLEHKFNDQIIPIAKKFDILGLPVPKEFGGREADIFTYIKSFERIGIEGTGISTVLSVHSSLVQKTLMKFGTDKQKERYLEPSVKGDIIFAFGLTEPNAGSNPQELQMNFKKEQNSYILNGTKYLISNGTIADTILVFAKSTIDDKTSAFMINTNQDGFEKEELASKMGTPTTDTGMFELTDFKISTDNLVGEEGQGWQIAKHALIEGRLGVAAGCVGSIKDCLIESIEYSKERMQYGKAIAKHQLIQEHIAGIEVHLSSAEAMVNRAVTIKDKWDKNPEDKELMKKADLAIAEAKLFSANAAFDAADKAVQIFGGRGWSFWYRPGRHLVDTRVCKIYEGTEEILKLKIAAGVLGNQYQAYY
ncbi:MAG: acyl-CoA/acyl-ACP dehydrogenase [Nitrosopumilus sp.]|nr:acyl-CoA/acyl-ACP dehydrogenase [Nitrosopumilus sp.]MDH3822751.1 acyl-CoA/acyl-ACP dehydrogenase [Nitrosopumilus sp.]MDH3834095.1 acyl-CoA/acyl-ACP dehydrogenase [Nitrosopumilus sp.]